MNKQNIKNVAYQRMSLIEDLCGNGYVEPCLQAYWRLNRIIAGGFDAYVSSFGYLPIDAAEANEGRELLGLGELCQFEQEVVQLLRARVEAQTDIDARRRIRLVL